jgi:hypothetical protein
VRVVEAAVGKDAADHLAAGRGLADFKSLAERASADDASEGDSERGAVGSPAPSLVTRGSAVRSKSIRWAWTGRLALGYLTVETGIEGLGKSVFAAWMLARLTRGDLPGEWRGEAVNVLIVAGEDGIEDTWKPRLDLAGADPDRWASLNLDQLDAGWNLRDGIEQIRGAVEETGATVVFIDAALDHMPAPRSGESIHSPTFVRQVLGPLKRLVRDLNLVGLFSMHPPKARSSDFRDLVQASQAFSAIPRVGLLFAWHPDDAELPEDDRRRVLVRGKGNIGRNPGALEFRIVGHEHEHDDGTTAEVAVVEDVAPSAITMADLAPGKMVGERPPTKAEQAAELIREALSDGGWHPAKAIREQLARTGLDAGSTRTHGMGIARVEQRKRPGEVDGPSEWRIVEESVSDGPFAPTRARSTSRDGLFDSDALEASNDGKSPRVRDADPSDPPESKSPSPDGGRARTRTREDGGGGLIDDALATFGTDE